MAPISSRPHLVNVRIHTFLVCQLSAEFHYVYEQYNIKLKCISTVINKIWGPLSLYYWWYFFYPAVCAHVHSITCYHLKLFILIICKSHCTVQICITNKLHDYIAWSHLMLCCWFRSYNFVPHNYIHCITLFEPVYFTYINMICSQYFLLSQLVSPPPPPCPLHKNGI